MARRQVDPTLPGQRGRSDHEMRARIVATAQTRFRREGFGQTSVTEIASDLGVTPAYVYKFFASKLAICEAVCSDVLGQIDAAIWRVARLEANASERLSLLYTTLLKESVGLFFAERKLHDMVLSAMENRWVSIDRHNKEIRAVVAKILSDGVKAGEFALDLPLDEAINAVSSSLNPFAHPALLQESIHDDLDSQARACSAFALRALRGRP